MGVEEAKHIRSHLLFNRKNMFILEGKSIQSHCHGHRCPAFLIYCSESSNIMRGLQKGVVDSAQRTGRARCTPQQTPV